jgi:hypothetical protein
MTCDEICDIVNAMSNNDICDFLLHISERLCITESRKTDCGKEYFDIKRLSWAETNGTFVQLIFEEID